MAHARDPIGAIAVCNFNFKLQLKSAMAFIGLTNNEIKIMRAMTAKRRLCRYPANGLNTCTYSTYIYKVTDNFSFNFPCSFPFTKINFQ